MIEPTLVAELLGLGVVAGFLAGLLGVGGGMMLVPFLTFMIQARGVPAAMAVKMAIATSMATIVFTSLSSLRTHHQHGNVVGSLVARLAPGIVAGGLLAGAGVFATLKGTALAALFSLFVAFSATQMLLDRKPKPSRQMPGTWGILGMGTLIGLLSGLVGAGGAFISVPFMTWCNVPVQRAIGTSAALGLPIALASTAGYIVSGWGQASALPGAAGYLWLPGLAVVASASVVAAPYGARTARSMDIKRLKRIFAFLLYALAASMLVRAFA
jgi:uncharacterized protein